ncbi:POT family protein [Aphelenchoides avenae]|nr:POT family protein [Aphelenchus avenae]
MRDKGDAEVPHQPRFIPPSAEPLLLDTVPIRPSSRSSQCRENRANAETEAKMMKPEKGLIASLKSYPPGVFFMLGNEFCERFSFYGMRAILVLYLINEHHFQESTASLFYHAFTCLAYISPLLGSIAADNYFGRFRVILWVSLFYVLGHGLLSIGAVPYLGETFRYIMDFGGLAVIALATGGIKPCVSAFAADQFDEDKHEQRTQFFSFFYFAINAGSLVAIMVTPILRGRVKCFKSEYCFPLAFGVPGVLMLFAFIIFVSGWRYYKIAPAGKGNVIWKVFKCIAFAIRGKFNAKLKGQDKAVHWLDYASPKYSESLIAGVKSLVSVSILFIPIVFFWALFDQQGSTWVLQARRMDGRVGPLTILPDQMNTFNPLIILISVPIFEAFIYPALRRVCNVTPLRKMAAGGVLAALAFIMAGLLQLKVNETMEPRPAPGNIFVQRIGNASADLKTSLGYDLLAGKNEWPAGNYTLLDEQLELKSKPGAYVVGVFEKPDGGHSVTVFPYACEKSENGKTRLYLLVDKESKLVGGNLFVLDNHGDVHTQTLIRPGAFVDIQPKFISSPDYVVVYGGNCSGPALSSHKWEPRMW